MRSVCVEHVVRAWMWEDTAEDSRHSNTVVELGLGDVHVHVTRFPYTMIHVRCVFQILRLNFRQRLHTSSVCENVNKVIKNDVEQ